MKNYFLIMLCIFPFFSCHDQKMERQLVSYDEDEIKTNGYYYSQNDGSSPYNTVYFFFRNGTFKNELIKNDGVDEVQSLNDSIKKFNWEWRPNPSSGVGAFWREDSANYELQFWEQNEFSNILVGLKIKIINDSTFVTTKRWLVYDPDKPFKEDLETFHFVKLDFKPDSLYFERERVKGAKHVPK